MSGGSLEAKSSACNGFMGTPHGETRKEESSFSEEKEAKRLLFLRSRIDPGYGYPLGSCGEIKVFCFFSSEKKNFFLSGPGST
jgi:hypothetical protein